VKRIEGPDRYEEDTMSAAAALGSGFAGASTLTLIHQTAQKALPDAPRADLLGMRAIAGTMRQAGLEPPSQDRLYGMALCGDLTANSLYYSLVGLGRPEGAWLRGALLGLAAGLGAVFLPGPLGLGRDATDRNPANQAMTVAWYLAGGLAAAAAYRFLRRDG
jgi:hypothetical protein